MKNFIKSFGKTFILGISFALGILTVYAASNLINSVTEQTINKGDKIGSGWFQEVNDKVISNENDIQSVSGDLNKMLTVGIQNNPGKNCEEIINKNPLTYGKDGKYWIDPDGDGGVSAFEVYCDMTTDGGGWIKLAMNNSMHDNLRSAGRQLDWCYSGPFKSNNSSHADYYSQISGCPSDWDFSYNAQGDNRTYKIEWLNFADNSLFTDQQLNSVRSIVTTLSDTTEVYATTADDDGNNLGHEAYFIDTNLNQKHLTTWTEGNNSTTTQSINVDNTSFILPDKIKLGHFAGDSVGGGVAAGYEKSYVLVK